MSASKRKGTLAERLWGRTVVRPNGCREWTGYIDKKTGYGQIGHGGGKRHIGSHVAAWVVTHGPVPDGQFVLHRCDNRPCVEPSHLFLGNHADNMADMRAKGRGRGAVGARNGHARLTAEQVADIRMRYRPGRGGTAATLALEYGITRQYVGQLARGVWRRAA